MFEGGHSKSFSIFPIRVVYMPVEQGEVPATILISVSKRRFKRAVKRNRVKRQIREVYRKNKQPLLDGLQSRGQRLAIAFIYRPLPLRLVGLRPLVRPMRSKQSRNTVPSKDSIWLSGAFSGVIRGVVPVMILCLKNDLP